MVWLMTLEPICYIPIFNFVYILMHVTVHVIQKLVFGRVRPIERLHLKVRDLLVPTTVASCSTR